MAKTGFRYTCAGILKEDETGYEKGKYLGKAATFSITVTSADVKDYGDNGVAETDTSVTGGTVSLELNEMVKEHNAFLLGHTLNEESGEVIFNKDDTAPFIGIGAVGVSKHNNKLKYTAKFYKKAQFKNPNDENSTQQDSTTFTHTTLEGNMYVLDDGSWKLEKEFPLFEEAKTWLDKKVGITATPDPEPQISTV